MNFSIFDVAELLNVIPEILIIVLFFHRIFQPRYKSCIPYVVVYSVAFLILSVVTMCISLPQIQITATLFILLVSSFLLYDGSKIVKVFASIYYIAIIFISESLFIGVLALMEFGNPVDLLESGIGRICEMTIKVQKGWKRTELA